MTTPPKCAAVGCSSTAVFSGTDAKSRARRPNNRLPPSSRRLPSPPLLPLVLPRLPLNHSLRHHRRRNTTRRTTSSSPLTLPFPNAPTPTVTTTSHPLINKRRWCINLIISRCRRLSAPLPRLPLLPPLLRPPLTTPLSIILSSNKFTTTRRHLLLFLPLRLRLLSATPQPHSQDRRHRPLRTAAPRRPRRFNAK